MKQWLHLHTDLILSYFSDITLLDFKRKRHSNTGILKAFPLDILLADSILQKALLDEILRLMQNREKKTEHSPITFTEYPPDSVLASQLSL